MPHIDIVPEGVVGRFFTKLLSLPMKLCSGAFRESPQVTHFWNNRPLSTIEVGVLEESFMTPACKDETALSRKHRADVRFHLPIFGGWSRYVVIAPRVGHVIEDYWFIGWDALGKGNTGISLVPIKGRRVRVLLGPEDTCFFGIDRNGNQIPVMIIAMGRIGDGVLPYGTVPLH